MSSRDDVLAAVRANLPKLDRPLPWVPMFDDSAPGSLLAAFRESLLDMGGDFLDAPRGQDPLQAIRQRLANSIQQPLLLLFRRPLRGWRVARARDGWLSLRLLLLEL